MDVVTWVRRRQSVATVSAALLAVVLTSVVVVVATGGGPDAAAEAAARCDRAASRAAERRELDSGRGADVVVVGDSYAVGAGVDLTRSWPVRLPGRVHVDAFSGSGFSQAASPCGAVSYADRAGRALAGRPDALVVVQGGLNDHRQQDRAIEDGFVRLMAEVADHQVLVVGPPPAPDRAEAVPRVDALLERLATGFGATYLSMAEVDLDYLDGGLHPTARGHREFGDLVAAAVVRLLLASTPVGPAGYDRVPADGGASRPRGDRSG